MEKFANDFKNKMGDMMSGVTGMLEAITKTQAAMFEKATPEEQKKYMQQMKDAGYFDKLKEAQEKATAAVNSLNKMVR